MTPDHRSDLELPIARDDAPPEDFAAIVRRWQGAVHAVACATTGDARTGEDVAQETFVIAWQSRARLKDEARIGAWLCGIARNRGLKARSKLARAPMSIAHADTVVDDAHLDEDIDDAALEQLVWREVERLPAKYREALVLFHREGESIAAVASALGETEANVRQRLHRGREMLRAEIHGRIAKVLRRTLPGAAFTAAVMAELSSASAAPATASTAAPRGIAAVSAWTIAAVATLGAAAIAWWLAATRDDAATSAEPPMRIATAAHSEGATGIVPGARRDDADATDGSSDDPRATASTPAMTLVVTDLLGGAIEGARVVGAAELALGQTNEDGELAIAAPPADRDPLPMRIVAEGYATGYVQPAGAGRIAVELAPESTFTARVVDESGAPIVGATVEHRSRQHDRGETTTIADGTFVIRQLAPGPLHLTIRAPGRVRRVAAVTIGPVAANDAEPYVLRRGAAIRGHVDGDRPRDLEAYVMPRDVGGPWPYDGEVPRSLRAHMVNSGAGGYLSTVEVDEDGDFAIEGVPPGAWEVSIMSRIADYPDDVTSTIVQLADGDAHVAMRLPTLSRYTVFAHDASGRALAETNVQWELEGREIGRSCATDARGRCEAMGEGTIVSARVGGRTIAMSSMAIREGIVVDVEGPSPAPRTATVRGTIVDAGGAPLPGRALLVAVKDPRAPGDWPPMWTVFTDATGRFVATGLPPGDARVMALPATRATGEALRLVEPLLATDRLVPLVEHTVRIADGDTQTVDLRLPARVHDVRGTVVAADGSPVAGAFVSCGTQEAAISSSRTEPTPIDTAISDDDGAFVCTGALAGDRHTVTATSPRGATGAVVDIAADDAAVRVVVEGA